MEFNLKTNKKNIKHIKNWLKLFYSNNRNKNKEYHNNDKNTYNNSILITGESGCGKTFIVNKIINDFGYEIKDYSDSFFKSNKKNNDSLIKQNNILHELYDRKMKYVVVVDNCENITIKTKKNMIKYMKLNEIDFLYPTIFISNTTHNTLKKDLVKKLHTYTFKKPSLRDITYIINKIFEKNNIQISKDCVKFIINKITPDIRKIIQISNDIISFNNDINIENLTKYFNNVQKKIQDLNLFESTNVILNNYNGINTILNYYEPLKAIYPVTIFQYYSKFIMFSKIKELISIDFQKLLTKKKKYKIAKELSNYNISNTNDIYDNVKIFDKIVTLIFNLSELFNELLVNIYDHDVYKIYILAKRFFLAKQTYKQGNHDNIKKKTLISIKSFLYNLGTNKSDKLKKYNDVLNKYLNHYKIKITYLFENDNENIITELLSLYSKDKYYIHETSNSKDELINYLIDNIDYYNIANCNILEQENIIDIIDSIAQGDIIENIIYSQQEWSLNDIRGIFSCVVPSFELKDCSSDYPLDSKFPVDFNKTSTKHINYSNNIFCMKNYFKNKTISDYIYINQIIVNNNNGINFYNYVDIMDTYKFDKKIFESLVKLNKITNNDVSDEIKKLINKFMSSRISKESLNSIKKSFDSIYGNNSFEKHPDKTNVTNKILFYKNNINKKLSYPEIINKLHSIL